MSRRAWLLLASPVLAGAVGVGWLVPRAGREVARALASIPDKQPQPTPPAAIKVPPPPDITITVPSSLVKGVARYTVAVKDTPDWELLSVDVDGVEQPKTWGEHQVDTAKFPNGPRLVTVKMTDTATHSLLAGEQAAFNSRNTPPVVTIDPASLKVGQGQTLILKVTTDTPCTVTGALNGEELNFVADGKLNWALAGFDAMTRLGARSGRLTATDAVGNKASQDFTVAVSAVKYPDEEVWLPPSTSGLIGSDVNAKEIARLDAIFAKVTPAKRWSGPWPKPVISGVASDFATGRSYNGGPITSRHWGTDFDCQMGTPIICPAPGSVVLADTLDVRGNAVILDHGLGVFSCYYHQSRIDVKLGQDVAQGQQIGLSGATGAVTGPHLHWELRVRGEAVDPMQWTKQPVP